MTIRRARNARKIALKEWLRDPVDELALSRMWQAIDSRFPRRPSRTSHFLTLVPAIVAAASIGTAAYLRHDDPITKGGRGLASPLQGERSLAYLRTVS
jgi:hypothetical protein